MEFKDILVVTSHLRAKQGKEAELRSALEQLVQDCDHHEGLLLYSVHQDASDPASFLFYEHFLSEKAFRDHLASEELVNAQAILSELVEGESKIETWRMAARIGEICQ
ncbi:putative quinol monooxygenase [Halodesulfovibrio marinisediminis]|uniref:Quinol monooxygenase YgiN n=1 Tax=Halodesulfovibrio marinisediminis DSM 17456 TaxID=1121457 RepID=A0A1N6GYM5_9BACT|nr:antibiotic biosynthesis monooxygenase [Halodesulfovibrio marinisediminis]SIO12668.1 Quinol monooxygenase YgiN [Halodesulfovibrio marinisediminis DSM 17456]